MKNKLALQLLALLFTFSATGCNFFSDSVSTNDRASIEVALQRLESQSDQWQTILEDLQKQVGLTVQNDIQNLLTRAIDSTAEQANCLADIRIQQIKMSLINLMEKLAGRPEKAATPRFCNLSPDNIRMNFVGLPGYEHVIKISGYDMDSGVIYTKLHYRDGKTPKLVRGFAFQTHYHANFNFDMVSLDNTAKSFAFYHDNQKLGEVTIEKKQCEKKYIKKIIDPIDIAGFSKTRGDKDFGNNNAKFNVDVKLKILNDAIYADVNATATEVDADGRAAKNILGQLETKASTTKTGMRLYNTEPNFSIQKIVSPVQFNTSHSNKVETADPQTYASGDMVKSITYNGRKFAIDDTDHLKLKIVFNEITVELKETGDCVDTHTR
jgi:hypothetical protein